MPGIQQFDTTMHLLAKVLDLRARNQEVIAANIANAETIGKEIGPPPGGMGGPPKLEEISETEQTTLLDLIEETSEATGVDLIA